MIRFLHVGAAILWVGGQLALSLVVRPAAVETLETEARGVLFTAAGRRFGRIATMALMPLLLASGIALAWHRGVNLGALARPGYGSTLAVKIGIALASFVLAGVHGIAATRASSSVSRAVGIAGAVVSLAVVLVATSLVP